jgi:hypothetical protein
MEAHPKPVRVLLCGEDINDPASPRIIAVAKRHIIPPIQMKPRRPLLIAPANPKKCTPTMNAITGII